jgi:hypothetical protein
VRFVGRSGVKGFREDYQCCDVLLLHFSFILLQPAALLVSRFTFSLPFTACFKVGSALGDGKEAGLVWAAYS